MAEVTQRSVGLLSEGQVKTVNVHVPHCALPLLRTDPQTCGFLCSNISFVDDLHIFI
jgi:hypothetical protein